MIGEEFTVDFGSGRRINLDDVRKQREALMPDGEHAWVLSVIYGIDDPDKAMDEMELGPEEFVGVTAMYCLVCQEPYKPEIRYHKCPQKLATA